MRPGFFNDNRNRDYPFLTQIAAEHAKDDLATGDLRRLPDDAVVDVGFVAGLHAGFVEGEHSIWLVRVYRTNHRFHFVFVSDAPGLVGETMVFCRELADEDYATEYLDNLPEIDDASSESSLFEDSSSSLSGEDCPVEPIWSGFFTTGTMATLATVIADGEQLTGELRVEPGTIRNAAGSFIQSLNLANMDRTRASAAAECRDYCWPFETGSIFVQARCVQGEIRWREGYNCIIRQNVTDNSLEFVGSVGSGAGEPCEEVPLFPGDDGPLYSNLLTGGPGCDEVLRTINGAGGARFDLVGGLGVTVTPVPALHKLVVTVDMNRLTACGDDVQSSHWPDLEYDDQDCACGPN